LFLDRQWGRDFNPSSRAKRGAEVRRPDRGGAADTGRKRGPKDRDKSCPRNQASQRVRRCAKPFFSDRAKVARFSIVDEIPDRGSFEMKEVLPIDDPVTVDAPGRGM
jgi:hypothetical protein